MVPACSFSFSRSVFFSFSLRKFSTWLVNNVVSSEFWNFGRVYSVLHGSLASKEGPQTFTCKSHADRQD